MSVGQTVMVHNATTKTDASVVITSIEKPEPNKLMLLKWQNMLEFVADLFDVELSKITRIDRDSIDVIVANSHSNNTHSTKLLGAGSMDETVISQGQQLAIENSDMTNHWQSNEDVPVAYFGVAIHWPDNEVFGTLAIEDTKAHNFNDRYRKIMESFREMLNTDLALLMKADNYNRRTSFIRPSITPIKTGVCLFNQSNIICSWNGSAEDVLHYKAEEVLGKPIYFVFPMLEKIDEPGMHSVVTGNHALKGLYIEKSTMLIADDELIHVLSFSDQTEHLSQNANGIGELHRDEQSGLYNHHSIVEILNQEVKRAHRYKNPLTVVAVRIDGYEFVEDIHGEGSLDLIVQTLAIILKNETRDVDSIGRLGDEIFVVCLPSTDIRAAKIVSNRISKVSSRYSDDDTPFTVSTVCMEATETVGDWQTVIMALLNEN